MKEPWFPSFEQKKAYRRRLERTVAVDAQMTEEVMTAQLAGKDWPDGWSNAKKQKYLMGPAKRAAALQEAADAKKEIERNREIELVKNMIRELVERIQSTDPAEVGPFGRTWVEDLERALRESRGELRDLEADDWQDRQARTIRDL